MKFYLFIPFIFCLNSCSNGELSDAEGSEVPYAKGKEIYDRSCVLCHQESGLGIPDLYPPLAQSDYLLKDKYRLIRNIAFGLEGEIVVNGVGYNSIMPPQVLNAEEIMNVSNYVLNTWGNKAGEVSIEDVETILKETN
ncbi:c-type cytochrome [Crocinitomix catalasitica]|uniref:c-type cytochrome n=1 Tax=Crocinitomix catalasitica TaxID=184607 RepID=UPI0006852E34|nr:cytochrome c [Crocinitomix catalasitica]